MSRWARSDVDYIAIPATSGGCGGSHRRPVVQGARAKTWRLDCQPCCDALKGDPLWAANEADVPETFDETLNREAFEKRGAKDRDNVLALALASIANVHLPESLRRSISGFGTEIPAIAGTLLCQEGHDCEPGSKFCGECGSPMRPPAVLACPQGHPVSGRAKFCAECGSAVRAAIEAPVPVAARAPAAPVRQEGAAKQKPLKDWRLEDLQALARDKGLDPSGTRHDLLARIRGARTPVAA